MRKFFDTLDHSRLRELVGRRIRDGVVRRLIGKWSGADFDGVLGCDYFGAYRKYMRELDLRVPFCLAHLIRDVKYLTTLPDKPRKPTAVAC